MKDNNPKRSILEIAAFAIVGLIGIACWRFLNSIEYLLFPDRKKRLIMLIDLDKCIGCNVCSVACKSENGVALGQYRTQVLEAEEGVYPSVQRLFLPVMCNHCEEAPCLKACENKAIIKRSDGLVFIDKEKCKGLQLCIPACPYGAIYFNQDADPSADVRDYPSRAVGRSDKCDLCMGRIDVGLEPACSDTCPTDARVFGDMRDGNDPIRKKIHEEKLTGLLPGKGTGPQVYYRGGNRDLFKDTIVNPHN